ncbi:MAG: hypothetical protein WB778_05065 [Thermoplasmata archaeon]
MASGVTAAVARPFRDIFRRWPVLLLLALSPGIPEYLSGSSSFELLVVNPFIFFLFLGLNLGLYGPGVLLIRDAMVRWRKGWAALLLLGAAYGLLEEGTALSTLFNSHASVVSGLGFYGHYLGVNWIWVIGILQIHAVYSIGLPILLCGLALPETRGQTLLTTRQIRALFLIYSGDVLFLVLLTHYWAGWLQIVLAVPVAAGLIGLAYRLPARILEPPTLLPRWRPSAFLLLGLAFYPILLLVPSLGEHLSWAAPVTGAVEILFSGILLGIIRGTIGRTEHAPHLVLLAVGAVTPILLFGLLAQIFIPIVLVADVLAVFFFLALWRRYRPVAASSGTLPPALPARSS